MFQYFNYNFNEETFKVYINQQYQKYCDLNNSNQPINEKSEDLNNNQS